MKKIFPLIISAFATLLACSSNNGDTKTTADTLQSVSVNDTTADHFNDMLNCFTKKTDSIPDKYCYDFLGITKEEMFYETETCDEGDEEVTMKLVIKPELMKKAKDYILLVYFIGHEDDCDCSGHDDYFSLKTFTPNGVLIQSMDQIGNGKTDCDISEANDFYFKNDSTLYLINLTPANQNFGYGGNGEEPTAENDTATIVDLTKYDLQKDGNLTKIGNCKMTVKQSFIWHDDTHKPLNETINLLRKEREVKYLKWTNEAEKSGKI